MRVVSVGFNWKTPVYIRERLAFDQTVLPSAYADLADRHRSCEWAILSTCNRTEIIAARKTVDLEIGSADISSFLADFHAYPLTEFCDHLYFHEDVDAATPAAAE